MIKRTLYFGNPVYLSLTNRQLQIRLPEVEKNETLPEHFKREAVATIPIEDIGFVVLDCSQITLTHALIAELMANNAIVISCNSSHMPDGYMLPIENHSEQTERTRYQVEASEPLKKQLWQQTVSAKIANQAALLKTVGVDIKNMEYWQSSVKSGDAENHEARAAAYFWSKLFTQIPDFRRGQFEAPPNNLLNYGYAILRAVVARALVTGGLMPTLGIHHRNKYNSYCLTDDIMEPYRPVVDNLVLGIVNDCFLAGNLITDPTTLALTPDTKRQFLTIPTIDVVIDGERSPLMIAAQRTAVSLVKCYAGETRKLLYPQLMLQ